MASLGPDHGVGCSGPGGRGTGGLSEPQGSVPTPLLLRDAGMRRDKADMSAQGSQTTSKVSRCDDILMEDNSSTWLSRVG